MDFKLINWILLVRFDLGFCLVYALELVLSLDWLLSEDLGGLHEEDLV